MWGGGIGEKSDIEDKLEMGFQRCLMAMLEILHEMWRPCLIVSIEWKGNCQSSRQIDTLGSELIITDTKEKRVAGRDTCQEYPAIKTNQSPHQLHENAYNNDT
ncbi:hypothetical protein HJC23_012694 [Cyclotella cryptica]|uniref:Uncharacterized protein n=1 Tax=Cyclotella cryptica TaxID=29204 RepID=A0ABD3PMM2_9STRA|eukprot:CCRYP_013317-RA/>CCRYP_013317-RA protein AED:0.49 eAED:0.49 QI:0/-1/0/1/-1/1/1/0/102